MNTITASLFQMFSGRAPFLTKGSMVLFLGGEILVEKVEKLGDHNKAPPRGIIYFVMSAIIFKLLNYLFQKIMNKKIQSLTDYAKSLRTIIVNNVLNVYGLGLLCVFNCFSLFYLWRY